MNIGNHKVQMQTYVANNRLYVYGTNLADETTLTETVDHESLMRTQYAELVDPESLSRVEVAKPGTVVAVAAFCGTTRLIDNLVLE